MGLLDYDSLACLLEASPNRYPLSSPPWSFCTIMFFFWWGLHTLWESPRMAEQVSGTFLEW